MDGMTSPTMTSSITSSDRRSKKPSNRPAMQIYRPPGLRNGEDATNTKPPPAAGAKQLKKDIAKRLNEENNNEGGKCGATSELSRKNTDESEGSLPRADSVLSNDSTNSSQRSSRTSPGLSSKNKERSTKGLPYVKSASNVSKDNKRKAMSSKQIDDVTCALRSLDLAKENSLIEQFISNDFDGEEQGTAVGHMLVQYSIEENRQAGKAVARLAAQLLDSGSAQSFHKGTVTALAHYFECRDRLRIDHFRVWIAFLNFVSDLYASVGFIYEGELSKLLFRIFDYLLKAPVLETLKIEELESLIGSLLSVGYDLERQCPEQLAVLKDLIRDAFVEVQEPWARKMIMLLMELGASGWKLPTEANDYYFQHTNS